MGLFEVMAKIALDTSAYEKGLSGASRITQGFGEKLGTTLKAAAKAGAVAIGAATTAVTALATKSVQSYSKYEQLKGGVEKLFGDSADTIFKYADKAYKTAGMSANQYTEQATSFSASLINSLGGDTKKAAKQTDVAMRAMSDNVNVFGSNMGDVQNAFQGFAKQNYTMLDNLKLGYGGTKEEMQRLISDANEYGKSIGKASDLSIESFSDIITAIQLIQEKQNIAGTTSKEAAKTIEGSFNALKSSWENLLTGFADGNANVAKLTKTVAKNAMTAFDNVLPVAKQALTGIGQAIETVAPVISKKLPKVLNDLLPAATTAIGNLLKGVGSALPGLITSLVPIATKTIKSLVKTIIDVIPAAIKAANAIRDGGIEIINKLADGISKSLPKLVPAAMNLLVKFSENLRSGASKMVDAGLKLIMSLADGLIKNIPTLIKTVPTIISNLAGIINDNAPKLIAAGATLIVKLAKGIIISIPTLVKEFPKIIKAVVDVWSAFNWLNLGKTAITAIKNGVTNVGPKIVSGLKDIGSKAINAFKSVNWAGVGRAAITTIRNAVSNAADMILSALRTIGNNGIKAFKSVNWEAVGKAVINFIAKAARGAFDLVKSALTFVAEQAKNAFTSIDWGAVGKNVVLGIKKGITDFASEAITAAGNFASGVLNKLSGAFQEHSPSKATEKQAKYLVDGIVIGINKNKKNAEKSAQELGELVLQASEQRLNNYKVYNEESLELEVAFWNAVRKETKKGTQSRIDADAKYFEAKKAYVQQAKEQEKEAAQSTLNQWAEAVTLLRGTNGKITESGNKLYASLTQNVAKIKSLAKKAGVDYNSVLLEAADKRLSNAKSMREVDLEEEMIYWGKVSKAIKKGTQARIDADAKYKDAMKAYRESIQKVADEADTMAESFTKSIDEINSALDKSRTDAWDKYSSAIASRESSLVSTVKLFDQFKATDLPTYSGVIGYDDEGKEILGEWEATTDDIINNLHKQLVAVDEWDKTLDSLEQRVGNNEVLVDAFRNMGFDSYQTLKKINDMTDEQLKTYVAEFEMIQAKMHNRSKAENEDLRKQTEENIATMEADAKEQIATLEKSYNDKILELAKTLKESSSKVGNNIIKGTSNGIKDKLEDIKTAALKIVSKAESTKSQAKSSGKNIGSKISEGIEQGIRSGQSGIASTARSAALAAYNAAKQALNIHSPSRKFAWIGQMVDEGFAQGIDKNADSVENAISSLGNITPFPSPSDWSTATATVPRGAIGNNTTTITMNIYGAQGQDVKALADEVERRLNAKVARGGIAFA